MNSKHDRRRQRTLHSLSVAFVELLREKGYSEITVSDIIQRANIGRSTFYSYFHDKDELFVSELDRVIELLSQRLPNQENLPFFPSLGLFKHIGEEYELYKALLWTPGMDLLIKHMQISLSQRIEHGLQKSGSDFDVPLPVLANFISGSFLTLLKWWLENKRVYSPEEMDAMFNRLVLNGIES